MGKETPPLASETSLNLPIPLNPNAQPSLKPDLLHDHDHDHDRDSDDRDRDRDRDDRDRDHDDRDRDRDDRDQDHDPVSSFPVSYHDDGPYDDPDDPEPQQHQHPREPNLG